MNKIQFTSIIATIILGVTLFSTMTGLNEIEMANTVDYFNSDFTGLAFASPHDNHKQNKHFDPRLYVNTLSYNNADLTLLDSCDNPTVSLPCLIIQPRVDDVGNAVGDESEIFIADPALQSTRTAISVTIIEQDQFQPTNLFSPPHCLDQLRTITSFTVSTFNGIHGVLMSCDNVSLEELNVERIFDITYTFIETPVDKEDDTCDCDKPSNLLLQYVGPDNVNIEIYKKEGEVGDPSKSLGVVTVDSSGMILLESEKLTPGKDTLESNTVFRVMNSDKIQIAVLSVHTSCSKPLFIDQEFVANPGDVNKVVLTVLDGTDTAGNTTIPEAFCPTD